MCIRDSFSIVEVGGVRQRFDRVVQAVGDKAAGVAGDEDFFVLGAAVALAGNKHCLLYTSPSPRDRTRSRMPSSA